MESLLALQPDVIYVDEELAGQDLSKYKKIAKTEVFNLNDGTWRDHLKKSPNTSIKKKKRINILRITIKKQKRSNRSSRKDWKRKSHGDPCDSKGASRI